MNLIALLTMHWNDLTSHNLAYGAMCPNTLASPLRSATIESAQMSSGAKILSPHNRR